MFSKKNSIYIKLNIRHYSKKQHLKNIDLLLELQPKILVIEMNIESVLIDL